ncbi:peptidoglycan-binding domain-containing protein [Nocardioides sp.]|uniref:peptidoglycan-binding domain-containing protein n=1 Tax=Nocardioides sp. TaxID=35761 RepID=UPI0019C53B99|nr:peptidoglycan-binding domain-containing protein [Nocardioides sp.]MBC7274962.1 peptidoglycan-binding protein [Nocardioides sp.]
MQLLLNNVDSSGLVVDGHYGPATQVAVSAFQAAHGHLDEDGVVGEQTAMAILDEVGKLNVGSAGPPTLPLPETPAMPDLPPVTVPDRSYTFGGTLCADGWVSSSSGRGTCSWHGGVS